MLRPIPRTIPSVQTPVESSFRTSIASALERANQVSSSTMQPHIWAQASGSNSDPEELDYALTSCSDVFINDDLNLDLPEEDEEAQNADDAPVYGPYIPLEAEEAIAEFAEGKDIEQIADEYGIDEQDVLQLIEESDYTIDLHDESDLAIEESNPSSEIEVVEIIDGNGDVAIVVYDEEGNATTLDPEQEASREGVDDILEGVYEGESINEIAESQGLTREQIIAQLNAAGYELEILTDEAGNAIGIKIQDAQSGEEVASSSYNLQDGTRTSSFTDSEGNEFSQNESDSIEHVVQAGEYLTLIAEYYGVTLEDLKRDNPEYFASPRDPNLIYSGETLTINGSSTTTETTASGYTLTTHMDGSKTLQNADGTQVEMEQGSFLDVIAEEFLTTNIDNDDSETIKNDEVLQVIIDASLERSEITSLEEELEDIQTKIKENTSLLNQGLVDIEDYLHELKSEEKEMLGELEELWLNAEQTQAQWNVFALDPDYEDAINDVEAALDKAGWSWEPGKPEGTLEDARVRLDEVNAWVDLVTANREWKQQEEVFDDFQQLVLDTAREDAYYEQYFDPEGGSYEVVLDTTPEVNLEPEEYVLYEFFEVSKEGFTSLIETGGLVEQRISYDGSNHQLYLVNIYEDKEVKIQLTFSPDEEVEERSAAMQQLDQEWEGLKYGDELAAFEGHPPEDQEANQAWQEFISSNDRGDDIIATDDSLFGAASNLLEAKQAFDETTVDIKADEIDKISENISELTQARDEAMEQYGEGTLVPYGNGEPQQIDIDERHKDEWGHLDGRWVAPEVADAYDAWVAASYRYDESEDIKQRVRDEYEKWFPYDFEDSQSFSQKAEETKPIHIYIDDEIIEKDGQLYLKINYGESQEEVQLTFASEEELPEWRGGERWSTDQEWVEWKENAQGSDITNYLDDFQNSYNQTKGDFEAAITTYGEGSKKKVTDSLPGGIEPVLISIGDDQRWVHPEVADAQLALDDGQLARDTANLEKEQAQEAAATTTHLLSSPSTWQLLDNDAGPTLDPEDPWWQSDAYLEQHSRVLQAQLSLTDGQKAINVNQQGLLNANIKLIEEIFPELSELDTSKAEKDQWEEQERKLFDEIAESQAWLAAHGELAGLQENREALEEYQNQIQHELESNNFMLELSEEDRLDDKQQGKIDQQYHDQHPEAAAYIVTEKREQLAELTGSEDLRVSVGSNNFKEYVELALGTDENELVDSVIDEIVDIGGDQAKVEIVPILYLDPSDGERTTALFRVINENGIPYLVDESGKKYKNLDDYQNNNYLREDGKIFVPKNLNSINDIDGVIDYEWRQARVRGNVEKVVDPIVGLGTTVATVAMFIPPLAPVAAPLAFAGGAYLGGRALHKQFNHIEHGGEWNDTESWMNYLSVASTAMPMGSSLLRTGGMLRTIDDISGWQAFQASIGGARLKSSNLFLGRKTSTPSPYSGRIEAYMQSRDWRNVIAYGADWGAIGTGVPLMGMSLNGLLANGGQMSNLEKWDAWLGFGTGFVGTGLGIHGLSMTRPTRKMSITDQNRVLSVGQSLSERFFLEHQVLGKLLQLSPIFRSILQDSVKKHGVKIIVGERGAGSYYSPADNHTVIDLSLFYEPKAYRLALTLAEELSHSISNNKGLVNWALPGEEIKATPGRLLPLLSHEGQGLPLDSGAMRQAAVDSDVNALLQEEGAAYLTILKVRDEWLQAGVTIKSDYIPSDRTKIYEQYRDGKLSWYGATIALGDLIAKDRPSDAAPGETYRSAKTGQRENVWNQTVGSLLGDSLPKTMLPIKEVAFSFSSAKTPQDERLESLHAFLNDNLGQASQNHAYIVAENIAPEHLQAYGQQLTPHQLLLSTDLHRNRRKWRDTNGPIVLDIQNPGTAAITFSQKLSNIAGMAVVVPRTDNPSQWHVLRPEYNSDKGRQGSVELVNGKLVLTQGRERRIIQPNSEHLGEMIGAGLHKTAFTLYDKAIVIYRYGKGLYSADVEIHAMESYKELGAPYVAPIHGTIKVDDHDALVMDYYPAHSSTFEMLQPSQVNEISPLNRNSVQSLKETLSFIEKTNKIPSDIQFVVDKDGFFYLHDFHEIRVLMNRFELYSINELIKLSEAAVHSKHHPLAIYDKNLPDQNGETWSAAAHDSGENEANIQLPDGPDTLSTAPLRRQPSDKNLPLLNYEYDERGFWISNPNDPFVDIKVILADSSGQVGSGPINTETIIVTHFDRGEMPPGSGSIMLADLLRVYEIQPGRRLVFEGIINESTLHAYNTGGDPAKTAIGLSGERALRELGLEPGAYYFEQSTWGINLFINIAPQVSPEASPSFTYRLDSRHPDTVFAEGFQSRFGRWFSKYSQLEEAITAHLWAEDSVFVSTSNELQIAKGAGEIDEWVYVIVDPKTGILVDEFLGPHDWQGASEVVYDAIPREYIVGARQLGDNNKKRSRSKHDGELSSPTWARTYTGEFVRNPFFDTSLWPSSRDDANKHIASDKHNAVHGLGQEPRLVSAAYHPPGAPHSKPLSNISSDSIRTYDESLPDQYGETWSSAAHDSGGNEPKIRLPELPENFSLADGDDRVGRFQDGLFDSSVRDPDRFIASIESAKQNGDTSVFLISPQARRRIIGHLQEAWRHILFASPDTPVPHEYSQSDYAFLQALVDYVQHHRISMKEPQLDNTGSAVEGADTITYRLYHTPMELRTESFSQGAEIEHFLDRLISGAHFVMPQGDNGGDFFQSFKQSPADKFAGDAKGHSHYKRKGTLFRHSGMAYPNNINEAPSLLNALLIDRTEKNSTSGDTFLQLEGWPASGLLGIGGRHGQDYRTHRKTGWNISTYGASPYSEKQGLAISLEPAGDSSGSDTSLHSMLDLMIPYLDKIKPSFIYDLYSQRGSPQQLTPQWSDTKRRDIAPESYLSRISSLAEGRPNGAKASSQNGDWLVRISQGIPEIEGDIRNGDDGGKDDFFHFKRSGASTGVTERVYINAHIDHAPDIMEVLVRDVVDNPAAFPGVVSAKLSGPTKGARRNDNIVVYAKTLEARQRVVDMLRNYQKNHNDHFMPELPFMTEEALRGVALGAEPSHEMVANALYLLEQLGFTTKAEPLFSFGIMRSTAIFLAVRDTLALQSNAGPGFNVKETLQSRVSERFRQFGIDPDNPARNLSLAQEQSSRLPEGFTAPLARPISSPDQGRTFSSAQVVDFKPAQLRGLSETQIPTILPEHLAQISPGRITHFTPEQVAAFTKEQLAALTNDQVLKLTPRQLEALAPEQVTAFTREQLGVLRPKQISPLSGEQLSAFSARQLRGFSDIQIQAMQPDALAYNKDQLAALTLEQVRKLTPRQLEALAPEQIAVFTREQLGALRPKQISSISGEQLSAFSARQLRGFSDIQIQAIQPDALMHIKPNRLMWLWPEQVAALKPGQVAALTSKQIASLTSVQIAALTDNQIMALTPKQIASLIPGQITALTDKQVMALSTDQWQALTLKQLRGLSDEQLQLAPQSVLERAARPGTISVTLDADGPVIILHGMDRSSLGKLLAQLGQPSREMNGQGVVTFDRAALEGFLNPRAKGLLSNDVQLRVRAADNTPVEQGGKFQKTAIASALIAAGAVGVALSIYPTWNALAYAWRGASFIYRGYRQEATAAHKVQGRTLRFVEFFTICINTPNVYIGFFNDPLVNGSYGIGNTVYGAKAFSEVVTGKPQLPFADDLGLPAYLTGSTPSIYNSGADIFAEGNYAAFGELAAASFFGFGSIYLWTRDSSLWNQSLKHRFRPFGTSESSMGTGLLPVEVEPAGVKRDIAFAITIGGGLIVSSMDAFGFFGQVMSDSEPDDNLPSPEESSSEPDETPAPDQTDETPSPDQPDQPNEPTPEPTQTAEGDMGENGRINLDLESQDYDWAEVERNDTLSSIARDNDDSLDDMLALNDEHILDPDILYPGDRIYLPE